MDRVRDGWPLSVARARPPQPTLGLVFDLDGTIGDNMPVHVEAFAIFAGRHGLQPMTVADHRRLDEIGPEWPCPCAGTGGDSTR